MKQQYIKNYVSRIMGGLVLALGLSCHEQPHDLSKFTSVPGKWILHGLYRNDKDITGGSDFSNLALSFNEDGTYELEDPVNLPIAESGRWRLDVQKKTANLGIYNDHNKKRFQLTFLPFSKEAKSLIIFDFVTKSNTAYHYVFRKIKS